MARTESAIWHQFQWELLNRDRLMSLLARYDQANQPVIGTVYDSFGVGITRAGDVVRVMEARSVTWHNDRAYPNFAIVLQVIQGDGFLVQGHNRNTTPQPVGTIIVLRDWRKHRLFTPDTHYRQVWRSQYAEVPCKRVEAAVMAGDKAIAQLLEVA